MFGKLRRRFDSRQYVVITRNEVIIAGSLKEVQNRLQIDLDASEMTRIGNTYIVNLDEVDVDFCRDKRKMSGLFLERLHKLDRSWIYGVILQILTILLILSRGGAV